MRWPRKTDQEPVQFNLKSQHRHEVAKKGPHKIFFFNNRHGKQDD